jgi:hypothetical protein
MLIDQVKFRPWIPGGIERDTARESFPLPFVEGRDQLSSCEPILGGAMDIALRSP